MKFHWIRWTARAIVSRVWLCALLPGLFFPVGARADVFDTPAENLDVSLVTYGPGSIYWERFGHDAIRLHDRISDQSVDFNYGVFDFEDGDFMWNFARGYMSYMIDAEPSDIAQRDYLDTGRSVLEQRLALSGAQAAQLRSFLVWNLQPENASYDYDYLTNNCATRVRDALDSVLAGAIRTALTARPAPMTYRQQIDRLMAAQRGLMLGMDLGLGPSADRPLNEWEESFLPMVLAREIRTIGVPDERGVVRPLVVNERQIAPNLLVPPSPNPPDLRLPLGLAGLVFAVTMVACRARYPSVYHFSRAIYLVFAGVVGTVLLALWTLTIHHAAWSNANLLVFNPLAFLILVAAWRARRADEALRLARALVAIQVGAAVLGVGVHFLLGPQQNLPWLLLAVPPWLAIAAELWRGPAGSPAAVGAAGTAAQELAGGAAPGLADRAAKGPPEK